MFKICFYVPASHLEVVKQAIFSIGAGKVGDYDCCCWQTLGQGQFRALEGSKPFVGEQGKLQVVEEYKVELVCAEKLIKQAVTVLKQAHPYEEPAYDVLKVEKL
jgi:hypothetical protein